MTDFIKKFAGTTSNLFAGSISESGDVDGSALTTARFSDLKEIAYTWDSVQRKGLNLGNRFYAIDDDKIKMIHLCEETLNIAPTWTGVGSFYGYANDRTGIKLYDLNGFELVEMSNVQGSDTAPHGDWASWDITVNEYFAGIGEGPHIPTTSAYEYVFLPPGEYTAASGRIQIQGANTGAPCLWEVGLDIYDDAFTIVLTDTSSVSVNTGASLPTVNFSLSVPFTVSGSGGYMALHVGGTNTAGTHTVTDNSYMQINYTR